jgi:hypothetical protein
LPANSKFVDGYRGAFGSGNSGNGSNLQRMSVAWILQKKQAVGVGMQRAGGLVTEQRSLAEQRAEQFAEDRGRLDGSESRLVEESRVMPGDRKNFSWSWRDSSFAEFGRGARSWFGC